MLPTNAHKASRNGNRLTRICFTLNNYTEVEETFLKAPEAWPTAPRFLIVGREKGVEGTPHLQGFAVLGKQTAFSTLKKYPAFVRAHIEKAKGSIESNVIYCSKEGNYWTYGVQPADRGGGKSKELQLAVSAVESGESLVKMARSGEHGLAITKFSRGLITYRTLRAKPRSGPPRVFWFWGSTGTGKSLTATFLANKYFGEDEVWRSNAKLDWFDGYDGERAVIIDDFRPEHCKFDWVLRLTDRYPLRAPVKGGFVNWCPWVIFFTSPKDISNTFYLRSERFPEQIQQLIRRVTRQYEFPRELKDACDLDLSGEAEQGGTMDPREVPGLQMEPVQVDSSQLAHGSVPSPKRALLLRSAGSPGRTNYASLLLPGAFGAEESSSEQDDPGYRVVQ